MFQRDSEHKKKKALRNKVDHGFGCWSSKNAVLNAFGNTSLCTWLIGLTVNGCQIKCEEADTIEATFCPDTMCIRSTFIENFKSCVILVVTHEVYSNKCAKLLTYTKKWLRR